MLPLEMLLDGFRVRVQVDEDIGNAGAGTKIEPDVEQRHPANRHQALGNGIGERTQARAMSSR